MDARFVTPAFSNSLTDVSVLGGFLQTSVASSLETFAGCSNSENFSPTLVVPSGNGAIQCTIAPESGVACVEWMVDAKKLLSTDRQVISPVFDLKGLRLKFILHARGSKTGQRHASMRNSGGIGSLSLKSDEVNLEDHELRYITYRVSVGSICGAWSSHDFVHTPILRCPGEWNFKKAVDKTTKYLKIQLEITSQTTFDQRI